MLAKWTELLPMFMVKWLARRYCMRLNVGDLVYAEASRDVLVRIKGV